MSNADLMSNAGLAGSSNQTAGPLNLVYASDEAYAELVAVSVRSLVETNLGNQLHIHVISDGISERSQARIQESLTPHNDATLRFIPMPNLDDLAGVDLDHGSFSHSTYARLWLPDLCPDLDRIIYIDCDTLVLRDLAALWGNVLPGRTSVAGVLDAISAVNKAKIGLAANDVYVNAGVLLIDLDKWRNYGLVKVFEEFLQSRGGVVPHNDQGVINGCLSGQILPLPGHWNVMTYCMAFTHKELETYKRPTRYYSQTEYDQFPNEAAILHATGSFLYDRPWADGSMNPIAERWREVRARTAWCAEPLRAPDVSRSVSTLRWASEGPFRQPTIRFLGLLHAHLRDRLKSY